MTEKRILEAECPRCHQLVQVEATGLPYGPLFWHVKHGGKDGEPCNPFVIKFHLERVEPTPMEAPTTKLLDLPYSYGKDKP